MTARGMFLRPARFGIIKCKVNTIKDYSTTLLLGQGKRHVQPDSYSTGIEIEIT